MPTQIRCTSCSALLRLPDSLKPGSAVRCPKCQTVLRLPSQLPHDESDLPIEPDERPARSEPRAISPAPRRAPRPKLNDDEDILEEDNPDDEGPRRPRRRRKSQKSGSSKGLLFGLLGGGCLLLLVCGGALTFGIYQIAKTPDFKPYTSPEGRFTASFPGIPQKGTKNVAGSTMYTFTVEARGGNVAFLVMYNDMPAAGNILGPQFLLDTIANGFGQQVKKKKNIQIDGHSGMELEIEKMEGGQNLLIVDRVYLVGNRMYQVMVSSLKSKADPVQAAKFLDSFKLNK